MSIKDNILGASTPISNFPPIYHYTKSLTMPISLGWRVSIHIYVNHMVACHTLIAINFIGSGIFYDDDVRKYNKFDKQKYEINKKWTERIKQMEDRGHPTKTKYR